MAKGRAPQTEAQLEQDWILTWHWGNILKKVMLDIALDNIKLAELAKTTESAISRLRNGSLSQRNYIKVIRCLPIHARREYLEEVFFGDIPKKIPPDIKEKFQTKAESKRNNRSVGWVEE